MLAVAKGVTGCAEPGYLSRVILVFLSSIHSLVKRCLQLPRRRTALDVALLQKGRIVKLALLKLTKAVCLTTWMFVHGLTSPQERARKAIDPWTPASSFPIMCELTHPHASTYPRKTRPASFVAPFRVDEKSVHLLEDTPALAARTRRVKQAMKTRTKMIMAVAS